MKDFVPNLSFHFNVPCGSNLFMTKINISIFFLKLDFSVLYLFIGRQSAQNVFIWFVCWFRIFFINKKVVIFKNLQRVLRGNHV